MTASTEAIAVVIPACNARHRLGRTLASIAAQSHQPVQILVLDQESADGLQDWLLIRWPGVDLLPVRRGCALADALRAVAAPTIAFLEPGDLWPRDHLAALARAWAENVDGDLLAAPATRLSRTTDGCLRRRDAPYGASLSSIGVRTTALLGIGQTTCRPVLADEIRHRCAALTRRASRLTQSAIKVTEAAVEIPSWTDVLANAVASLPGSSEVVLLGLQAAHQPLASLEQLGLAVLLGRRGRSVRAFTLGDLTWAALDAVPPTAPLLLSTRAPLDLAHASDLVCLEDILRRSSGRPVRISARTLSPSTPTLLGRLLETMAAHPDVELWLGDAVSRHYAASLLGPAKVRLVPPPLLALAPLLRELAERALIEPAMLGIGQAQVRDLAGHMSEPTGWWEGIDLGAASRLAQGLARVLGIWRWLKGPVLQQAWLATLVGWARMRAQSQTLRTSDPDHALLAAMCSCQAQLDPASAKVRDFAATWSPGLQALGVDLVGP